MVAIAINVLWFLIGLIVLAGIIYLAIWVIESFIYPIPEKVKQGVWVTVLVGGGGGNPFRHLSSGERGAPVGALSAPAA